MTTNLVHVAQRMFNRPLAITADKAEIILRALAPRLGLAGLRLPDGGMRLFDDDDGFVMVDADPDPNQREGYDIVEGVALIEVSGTLVQKCSSLRPYSGMTGYNAIRANVFAAIEDPAVKAIALDIDSPGGECAGLFDLTDAIFAARGRKPIWALLDETAASAAYAIAAAADRITVPRTGYAGSIGVIVLHADFSRLLDKEGITVTVLQYGERKADGQPVIPLSEPARKAMQADIDTVGELFVGSVARYRQIPVARVRDTQAAVFMGAAGRAPGLVDDVMSPADALSALVRALPKT